MAPTDDAFRREARSQIRTLNDGLLAAEAGGDADAPVAELFRVAHSLKGSCRTRGLDDAGDLAHAVEDALDALRAGAVEPTPALIDEALATVDLLEATVRTDAVGGDVEGDVAATCASLRATLDEERARTPTDSDATLDAAASGFADPDDDWDPAEEGLSDDVVAALEETSEFDDIDGLLDGLDDPADDEELDGWGMLGDEGDLGTDSATSGSTSADSLRGADDADSAAGPGPAETPDEPSAFFEETKRRVDDDQGVDDLQADIDAVEFGEFDDEDTYTIEELLALEPEEDPDEDAAAAPSEDGAAGPASESADAPTGSGDSPDLPPDLLGTGDVDADPAGGAAVGESSGEPADAIGDPLGLADADPSPDDDQDGAVGAPDATTDASGEPDADGEVEGVDETDETEETEEPGTFVFGGDEAEDAPESGDGSVSPGEPTSSATPDEASDAEPATAADDGTDADTVAADDGAPDADPVPDDDSIPDADSVPTAESAPNADSLPDPDAMPDAEPASDADPMPDPDSLPETDLGVDLRGEFDADLDGDSDAGGGAEMDVAVDEEMAEFESRFGDLLGTGPGSEDAGDEGEVFRSAVPTIEASSLDAAEFPDRGGERAGDTREFDRLQATTVDVETADRLLNVAEELSLSHLRLDEAVGPETDEAVREEVSNLLRIVTEYRRTVVDVRLVGLETALEEIPRTVRDVARSQGKEVEVVADDADVELDRSIVDRLRDPLVHLARNAVDHGIEPPEEREAAGKARDGTVAISAERVGDEVVVELSDDGRGVDPEAVRDRAVENGVVTRAEAAELSDEQTYDLLFEPGFTTSDEVTDVSGRGVGMDVVHRTVADLNGTVSVESDPGVGTTVRLTVPVSIALTEVLFVATTGQTFGVPMTAVEQVTPAPPVETENGREVVRRSDLDLVGGLPEGVEAEDAYPHVRLASALGLEGSDTDSEPEAGDQMVWLRTQAGRLALRCDRMVTSQEVVVRPYGDLLRDVPGVSGATTLGDGRAVNVLDVATL
ncbi:MULTISPECIES: ATP-binding protein [Halorussus]|uniref:ATP-binding protein n=1 Tax=Halorussus TaxID=1070314 RepID=UPI000E2138F9|nr:MULTISPECIES: ATP-binding protein [Halorussus]NHN57949.1 hypothetical protein [Halorussus sp. JP-T4]